MSLKIVGGSGSLIFFEAETFAERSQIISGASFLSKIALVGLTGIEPVPFHVSDRRATKSHAHLPPPPALDVGLVPAAASANGKIKIRHNRIKHFVS